MLALWYYVRKSIHPGGAIDILKQFDWSPGFGVWSYTRKPHLEIFFSINLVVAAVCVNLKVPADATEHVIPIDLAIYVVTSNLNCLLYANAIA